MKEGKNVIVIGAGIGGIVTAIEYFTASERSIALLPFANLNNDPEQEYFITGLHTELIGSLGASHNQGEHPALLLVCLIWLACRDL
jgi:hypothetical protein